MSEEVNSMTSRLIPSIAWLLVSVVRLHAFEMDAKEIEQIVARHQDLERRTQSVTGFVTVRRTAESNKIAPVQRLQFFLSGEYVRMDSLLTLPRRDTPVDPASVTESLILGPDGPLRFQPTGTTGRAHASLFLYASADHPDVKLRLVPREISWKALYCLGTTPVVQLMQYPMVEIHEAPYEQIAHAVHIRGTRTDPQGTSQYLMILNRDHDDAVAFYRLTFEGTGFRMETHSEVDVSEESLRVGLPSGIRTRVTSFQGDQPVAVGSYVEEVEFQSSRPIAVPARSLFSESAIRTFRSDYTRIHVGLDGRTEIGDIVTGLSPRSRLPQSNPVQSLRWRDRWWLFAINGVVLFLIGWRLLATRARRSGRSANDR